MKIRRTTLIAAVLLGTLLQADTARACPLCEAIGTQTLSEQVDEANVIAIVRLVSISAPKQGRAASTESVPQALFRTVEIIKSTPTHKPDHVSVPFSREAVAGSTFLLTGVTTDKDQAKEQAKQNDKIQWAAPIRLTARSRSYVKQLASLPKKGPQRLAFFQAFLEDDEELLASDSYDEFARASYAAIKAFKDELDRGQLLAWIQSPDMPATRKRLYLMMLSACGTEAEIPMLEQLLRQEDRKAKAGFDSVIACYLTLTGPQGLKLVNDLFLHNKSAAYIDTYATIMALRFHAAETDVIPREQIMSSLRLVLGRPQMADLVIPDLARGQDWSAIDQLVEMFKNANSSSSWSRIPIINYLRACPLPEAKAHLAQLEQIAPKAFEQANSLFPVQTKSN
jgi:hypothetical protein